MSPNETDTIESNSGSHAARLVDDGPVSWSNADGLRASRSDPVIDGLDESTVEYLVDEHPFDYADSDPDGSATESDDSADTDVAATMPDSPASDSATSDRSGSVDPSTDDTEDDTDLQSINGVGPATATKLSEAGYETVDEATSLTQSELEAAGVAEHSAKRISKQG